MITSGEHQYLCLDSFAEKLPGWNHPRHPTPTSRNVAISLGDGDLPVLPLSRRLVPGLRRPETPPTAEEPPLEILQQVHKDDPGTPCRLQASYLRTGRAHAADSGVGSAETVSPSAFRSL